MIIFPSWTYFVFLTIVAGLYWKLNHRLQNIFFLICSYFFYATWDWRFLSIIISSTCIVYFCALRGKYAKDAFRKNAYFYFIIFWTVGMLCFFKYANFFVHSLNGSPLYPLIKGTALQHDIFLPLGISFYTFEFLSYSIDVYTGAIEPCASLIDLALFFAFFPKLTAGPIERAKNLLVQIQQQRAFDKNQLMRGVDLIVWGLVKKLVVADNLGVFVDMIFAHEKPSLALLLLGGFGFGIQLYADFSAYTDFARGSAKVLGFNLTKNFNKPFLAKNIMDFWGRWHMSLTLWMQDYIYLPLVLKFARSHLAWGYVIAVILSWGFMGIWHGSQWKFLFWGWYFAVLILGYRFILKPILDLFWRENFLTNLIAIATTYIAVNIGFLLFRIPSLRLLEAPIKQANIVSPGDPAVIGALLHVFLFYSIPLLGSFIWGWWQEKKQWDLNQLYGLRVLFYTLAGLLLILLTRTDQHGFMYFKF